MCVWGEDKYRVHYMREGGGRREEGGGRGEGRGGRGCSLVPQQFQDAPVGIVKVQCHQFTEGIECSENELL